MKKTYSCLLILLISAFMASESVLAQTENINERYPLIPFPTHLKALAGTFEIQSSTTIKNGGYFPKEVAYLRTLIRQVSGYDLKVNNASKRNVIVLSPDSDVSAPEGYRLNIQKGKIILSASSSAGIFHGIETIRQLLPVAANGQKMNGRTVTLPAVDIEDAPEYGWRGMHLDVARHFFSIAYLKKFIDVMALYKMNKLHLHLTDDQGWRIEIKKYPKLTEEGAWRSFNSQDSDCIRMSKTNPDMALDTEHIIHRNGQTLYGGFYTQQQMRDLVAYAARRHIDIVPEIDMPGHMMAAIHSYPFLSCEGGSKWGKLFSTPICPCNESTFQFAENIYKEIFSIFPSKYIHLGADEVDRTQWAKSPACKVLMQQKGLKNVDELQSYFVKRMEKFFNAHGRKLIGWDEILEGGVSKTAYVMYWRSWVPEAPVKAARHGNYVIMTPGDPLYFDRIPDAQSIKEVYDFNPVPKALNAQQAKFILGAQANIWTEHIPSENRADFMYMPRMTALSEVLWSHTSDYKGFMERLNHQYRLLDEMKVHYRLPDLTGFVQENVFTDSAVLSVKKPVGGLHVHYTTDGSIPEMSSPLLPESLVVKTPETIKFAAYSNSGARGEIYELHYKQEDFAKPLGGEGSLEDGLVTTYYKKFFKTCTALNSTQPDSSFIAHNFVISDSITAPSFGLRYKGFIEVPQTGIYTFYLTCDDGGILTIGNQQVVNNDGLHSAIQKTGQVALAKGLHPFQLNFIEGGGGFKLDLKYAKGLGEPADIPQNWLKYQPESK